MENAPRLRPGCTQTASQTKRSARVQTSRGSPFVMAFLKASSWQKGGPNEVETRRLVNHVVKGNATLNNSKSLTINLLCQKEKPCIIRLLVQLSLPTEKITKFRGQGGLYIHRTCIKQTRRCSWSHWWRRKTRNQEFSWAVHRVFGEKVTCLSSQRLFPSPRPSLF